ncbi:hypothetical protein CL648_04950 [bacterium]|jgi:hypothetical protein|nr:hypothetical protein [bacterium]|tara:strand:- start:6391 stop:7059 length:669 start_codon:yes stop_codon:yes gene_type:complete
MIKLVSGIVIFSFCTLAFAAPTIGGPTGLLEMPTAERLQYQEYNIGIDYLGDSQIVDSDADKSAHYYKLNIGTYDNIEMGVVGGKYPEEGVFVNMKYHVFSEQKQYPVDVAVGLENLTANEGSSLYMVASKAFQTSLTGHVGFRALFEDSVSSALMMGGEYFLNDAVSLIVDMIGDDGLYRVNMGARWFAMENLVIQSALLDGIGEHSSPRFMIGASISKFL